MSRVIALVAVGVTLAACSSSSLSSFTLFSGSTGTLRVESVPPGADARTLDGLTCRTPCELTVPLDVETTLSIALGGYEPVSVIVRADPGTGLLTPNPILIELRPAPPPPTPKKKPPPQAAIRPATTPAPSGRPATTQPTTTTTQPQSQPQAAPPPAGFPPPPQTAPLPWPTNR
jgi:hypothetical protein